MSQILIVEDDAILNRTLCYNLASAGRQIISAKTCAQAMEAAGNRVFDLAILDINLPDGSGFELCRFLHEKYPETFILFLTGNDRETDMLRGYSVGGYDYITKPFSILVLNRKLSAILNERGCVEESSQQFDDGTLKIDFIRHLASLEGQALEFTPREYAALHFFISNPRRILTRQQLIEALWEADSDFIDEHTLTTLISRIRTKLCAAPLPYIKTAYGLGYQWTGTPADAGKEGQSL